MIALKLEQMGSNVVLVLDDETRRVLHLEVGDTIYLQPTAEGVIGIGEHDTDHEARTARGRAFLKRYQKTLGSIAGS